MSALGDCSEALEAAVRDAHLEGHPLLIAGSGSKAFLHRGSVSDKAARLAVAEHCGVVDYRPEELVVTVRSGTPLRELTGLLDQHQQIIPFDPPQFSGGGTIGGAVASGLSGPARPWRGAVRDCLLGVEMLNGLGDRVKFGGQVLKNVAGYDVSRLQAGAFGTLGVLLGISIRLLPKPTMEMTCCFELGAQASLKRMRDWARRPLPLSGVCFVEGVLYVRLSGAEAAVATAVAELGGDTAAALPEFWQQLRDHELAPFTGAGELLRMSLPAAAQPVEDEITEWGGALRWLQLGSALDAAKWQDMARAAGGSAALFDGTFARRDISSMAAALRTHHQRIKRAFDPDNILNPGLVELNAD